MHLLVATAGVLPPEPVADFASLMVAGGGSVTVMSVVPAPREFLEDLVTEEWRPFEDSHEPPTGATSGEETEVQRYVDERGTRLVAPVVAALTSRGIEPSVVFVESDDAGAAIVEVAERVGAGTIVMGATRKLFNESAWTSVSMKVTAESKLPVLLIPAPSRPSGEDGEEYDHSELSRSGD